MYFFFFFLGGGAVQYIQRCNIWMSMRLLWKHCPCVDWHVCTLLKSKETEALRTNWTTRKLSINSWAPNYRIISRHPNMARANWRTGSDRFGSVLGDGWPMCWPMFWAMFHGMCNQWIPVASSEPVSPNRSQEPEPVAGNKRYKAWMAEKPRRQKEHETLLGGIFLCWMIMDDQNSYYCYLYLFLISVSTV